MVSERHLGLWGTWQVLNKPQQTPGRTAYLALQGVSWVDFVLFNAAYLSLRSPLNALVLTFVMFLLTIVSGLVTFPVERYQGSALPGHIVPLVDRGADRCDLSGAVEQG